MGGSHGYRVYLIANRSSATNMARLKAADTSRSPITRAAHRGAEYRLIAGTVFGLKKTEINMIKGQYSIESTNLLDMKSLELLRDSLVLG
jgi:hypothetical protein